jgi:hypothetical protein
MRTFSEIFRPASRSEFSMRVSLVLMDVICETARFETVEDERYLKILNLKFGMNAKKALEWIGLLKDIGLVGQDNTICVDNMWVSYAVDSPHYQKIRNGLF